MAPATAHPTLGADLSVEAAGGSEDLVDEIDDDFLGTRMYWSHYNSETYLKMLRECRFSIIWARHIEDETCAGAKHLFVLAQKQAK